MATSPGGQIDGRGRLTTMKHGTRAMYITGKCRCRDCAEANRLYSKQRRRAQGIKPQQRGTLVPHGSYVRYSHGCRCASCREASIKYQRQRRAERRAMAAAGQLPEHVEHGQASTYRNWGCRCEPCTKAHSEYCKPYTAAWRQRQRAKAGA